MAGGDQGTGVDSWALTIALIFSKAQDKQFSLLFLQEQAE